MAAVKTRTIRQSVVLPAPPIAVYQMLAESRRHSAFTGAPARLPRKAGRKMMAYDGYISGTVLGLRPGAGLVQTWRTSEWPAGVADSRLEIRLAPVLKGTRLTMVHSEVPAERFARYSKGWREFYWKPLRRYLSALTTGARKTTSARRASRRRRTKTAR